MGNWGIGVHRCARFMLFALLLSSAVHTASAEPIPDIRVVIDVSGSMKANDPENLRRPALKLLVGLMPENMHSGVWTFGQYVNMQVKYGVVNESWKTLARREADNIHSRGLYTNIEEALQKASFNWSNVDPRYRRSLILLTDGMVDISKDPQLNQASRQRLLDTILPRLQRAGVKIHSIALSEGVDRDLLQRLSASTQGWYEQVNNAAELQRVFLRLFEKSTPIDALPIKANRFTVDSSVRDMTLLVFRSAKDKPLQVSTPAGKTWSSQTHPATVKWHHEDGYDLVTVKQPDAGEWKLLTTEDPDNRVMIVTNLKLKTNRLPDSLLVGEKLPVTAQLEEEGNVITRSSFLKLVKFEARTAGLGITESKTLSMQDDGKQPDNKAGDGQYSVTLDRELVEGNQTLLIKASGATFEREQRHRLRLFKNVADVSLTKNKETAVFQLLIRPHIQLLKSESININVQLADGNEIELQRNAGNEWFADIEEKYAGQSVDVRLTATRHNGEQLTKTIKQQLAEIPSPQKTATEQENVIAAQEATTEQAATQSKQQVEQSDISKQTHEAEDLDWIKVTWFIIGGNLFLITVLGLGYFFWKRREAKTAGEDEMELEL